MTDYIDKIICGDCLEVMKGLPDGCVDLTVTSPPYDNLRDYKGYTFDFEGIAQQLFRITKEGGVVVWIVGDATINGSETGTSFRQVLYFKEIGFNLHDTMIYAKKGASYPSSNRYYNIFEYMFVLCKNSIKTINLLKDRENKWLQPWGYRTRRNKKGQLINSGTKKGQSDKYGVRFNIWQYNVGSIGCKWDDSFNHPATFPEALARDHILSWSNEGDLVFDPMCGSGTTCKMALMNNRHYCGIEISQEYCDIANKRIAEAREAAKQMAFDIEPKVEEPEPEQVEFTIAAG